MLKKYISIVLCFWMSVAAFAQSDVGVSSTDELQINLARQVELSEQAAKLAAILKTLNDLPKGSIDILFNNSLSNEERILGVLNLMQKKPPKPPKPTVSVTNKPPPEKLSAKHVSYVEVASSGNPGVVVLSLGQQSYRLSVGERIRISGIFYTLSSIKNISDNSVSIVFLDAKKKKTEIIMSG